MPMFAEKAIGVPFGLVPAAEFFEQDQNTNCLGRLMFEGDSNEVHANRIPLQACPMHGSDRAAVDIDLKGVD